jgi:hypothetical protein
LRNRADSHFDTGSDCCGWKRSNERTKAEDRNQPEAASIPAPGAGPSGQVAERPSF